MIRGKRIRATGLVFIFFAAAPLRLWAQTESERLEKLERAVEQLQQRNAELEAEVRSLKGKTSTHSAARETGPAKSANESKAVVEKTEEKTPVYAMAGADEFKLTLGGYIQAQFEGGDAFAYEGKFASAAIKERFRIRRARVTLSGDYTEHFDFKVEGDFSFNDVNSTRTSFSATDVFVNWHTFPEFNIKVGQYKAPFGLEQLTPDPVVISIERSLVTDSLTPERQIGVQVWGKPLTNILPAGKDVITYYAGLFNGTGRNINTNDNNEFMYAGRLEVQAMKTKLLNQDTTLKFGVDGVYSRDNSGTSVSSVIHENTDGSLVSYNLPSAGQREEYGFDASLHIGPFDLVAEYLNDRISPRVVNGVAPLFTTFEPNGYYVQGSYYVIPKTLQLVAKWESFDPDQFSDDDIRSILGGVNYYIHGNNVRLSANYIHTWSDFRDSRNLPQSNFDEVIVRLQVMF
ncbi:MAG: porin [Chthoniobacterales bacterium]